MAQWCFETTLDYAKQRKQFGRAIGSYQAIKHRLADLWFEVSSATAAARYAADTCARDDEDAGIAAAVAQAYCSGVAVHAAEECVQLHGGIGMTWEYPAHLYLKRAKSDQLAFGTAYRHRARLAELVDLPPASCVALIFLGHGPSDETTCWVQHSSARGCTRFGRRPARTGIS